LKPKIRVDKSQQIKHQDVSSDYRCKYLGKHDRCYNCRDICNNDFIEIM